MSTLIITTALSTKICNTMSETPKPGRYIRRHASCLVTRCCFCEKPIGTRADEHVLDGLYAGKTWLYDIRGCQSVANGYRTCDVASSILAGVKTRSTLLSVGLRPAKPITRRPNPPREPGRAPHAPSSLARRAARSKSPSCLGDSVSATGHPTWAARAGGSFSRAASLTPKPNDPSTVYVR